MTIRVISLSNALLMVVLIIFWGSSFVVVKMALVEGLTPIAIATFRFLIAGGLFSIVLLLKKAREQVFRVLVEKKDIPTLLVLALSGVTLFFSAQYTGIQMAGAALAAIFVCLLSPILITTLATLMLKEHLSTRQIFGICVAAAGTFIVIAGDALSFQGNREFFFGSLILLSTPVLWTIYSLLGKKTLEKYDPFLTVAYVTMLGGLCLIPMSLAEHSLTLLQGVSLNGWLALIYLSSTCSLLGYFIWFHVLKQVGAAVASSFLFAEPLVTVIFAVTLVGEQVTLAIPLGGFLIFIGVYLVTRK
ncbi:MAG: EamA family transporter [Candidatus Bathyarchaeota archaeon]|nr:MAG: EamA family transporter [Candidatus Bathyarchaeota archaeon]